MATTLPEGDRDAAAERGRRNTRAVIILGLVAAAFYFGFIAMNVHG